MEKYDLTCRYDLFYFETFTGGSKNLSTYEKRKAKIYQEAINWQYDFEENNYSWGKIADFQDYFYKKGKKYGLLKEFKEMWQPHKKGE